MNTCEHELPSDGDDLMYRWALQKVDSGRLLSVPNPGTPSHLADFQYAIPLLFADAKTVHAVWLRWLTMNGFVKRRVTVANEPVSYDILQPLPGVQRVRVNITRDVVVQGGEFYA